METIISDKGTCLYFKNFLSHHVADEYFKRSTYELDWRQDPITLYGKKFMIPRLHCWYGDFDYTYSKITQEKRKMPKFLNDLKVKIEEETKLIFNGVLGNLYRDGRDSNGWHRDNERELIKPTHIASISLGEERFFSLRKRGQTKTYTKLKLEHGSLLVMLDPFQEYWEHQIPKTARPTGERINLTFRRG